MTVDVLLPYYGDVAMMKQAVESVLGQRNPDWTLTVIDDGYPDPGIPGYFAELAARDSRVSYHRNEQNLGANGNYRKALTFVRHELAVVMGADDVMLPNYIDTVVAAHQAFPTAQIIQPGVQIIDENNAPGSGLVDRTKRLLAPRVHGMRLLSGENLAVSLMRGNWMYFPSVCWKSDALVATSFREGLDVVQDLALALDLIKAGGGMVVGDTVCFQYRRHRASDSSWRALEGTRFNEERRFFNGMAEEFEGLGWHRAARTARLHLSSRLNAATLLPKAWRNKQTQGVRNLRRHVLARPGDSAQ
ncbi:glycosyltransferase family 2 protein [Oryzihumus leptocrescens]|uniref:Glycosyl transferase family 2 n=1 Tax=Oryzihumus leptocrescens TaxID=297536 RepID=A0A542ZGL6_9MICO|nr:glycosyltransferase family 2 protein [Oryzihumus leptocrescens]TQL59350.1 glycosyl transferase family 2 [Oryzihumus leptocrescens]